MSKLNSMSAFFNDSGADSGAGGKSFHQPGKSSNFKNETISQYKSMIQNYAMNFERMGNMPPIKKLLQEDKHNVIKGRSMIEFAMDSLAVGFADTFKSLDDSKLPVDLYKEILTLREGKAVSDKDAENDLKKRIAHARSLNGPNPENTDLLTFAIEPLGPQQTAALVNLRATILNVAANAILPKEVMETLDNLKESTSMVAKEFNKRVNGGATSASNGNNPGQEKSSEKGSIDLDLGGKSRKKGLRF